MCAGSFQLSRHRDIRVRVVTDVAHADKQNSTVETACELSVNFKLGDAVLHFCDPLNAGFEVNPQRL